MNTKHRRNTVHIGIDIGTTSISAIVVEDGKIVARSSRQNLSNVEGLEPGLHEQRPDIIAETALQIIAELKDSRKIEGIALTGQMHGLMAVDRNLNPLTHLITWRDQRTSDYPESIRRHNYSKETGCFLHPGYGGLTLHHLLKNNLLPKETHKVLSIPGYIAAKLTGICTIDETFAASWGIWNVRTPSWHKKLLEDLDIPEHILPKYIPSCTKLGQTLDGIPVYSPIGDNQAGIAGTMRTKEPVAVMNIGTSSQFSTVLPEFAFTPELETRPFPPNGFIQTFAVLCT